MSNHLATRGRSWSNIATHVGALLAIVLTYHLCRYLGHFTAATNHTSTAFIAPSAKQITHQVWDSTGNMSQRLTAPSASQRVENRLFALQQPRLMFVDGMTQWNLRADQALVDLQRSLIDFNQQVVVTRLLTPGPSPTTIQLTTPHLRYDMNHHHAYTNAHVYIQQNSTTLSAQGLEADLTRQTFTLLHHAKGRYEPHQ